MDIELRIALVDAIEANEESNSVISSIELDLDGRGTVTYNDDTVWVDPSAPGFSASSIAITDEELVRAYLLTRLHTSYEYPATTDTLEIERVYKAVGRPGKGGRIDVLLRRKPEEEQKKGDAFLFIECKSPSKFDEDLKLIDGQLFRLSRQEDPRPRYLVYYTVELKAGELRERLILIDSEAFPEFSDWDEAGQPITDALPSRYGRAAKRRYACVPDEDERFSPLDREVTQETFNRLRAELHDVIWGGGGTNNNEVFVYITRLILCKIYDEQETLPDEEYQVQRRGDAVEPEPAANLARRMNALYKEAEQAYLALPDPSEGPAFDTSRISAEKIAYVVGRLESISVTENDFEGDLLGEFFEQIVEQDFTQSKGQFFTPVRLVRFMLYLSGAAEQATSVMTKEKDHLGRPRLPFVIDPAAGAGTFLIEYMKLITASVGAPGVAAGLSQAVRKVHEEWFGGSTPNSWARSYLFAVENNYDLGLAAKVNMVLHGDGSTNTWISSGLLPFDDYWIDGRHNILGTEIDADAHPYGDLRNEQFDLIVSNPPFSIKMSPDEKTETLTAFKSLTSGSSEALFIERWYQLLREGGRFCCVLPEAILDTSTNGSVRLFMLQHFRLDAIVSLPYDAFRPFTSTKTCVVLATKRPANDVTRWRDAWAQAVVDDPDLSKREICARVLAKLEWHDDAVFMAEPESLGYKRRKNLPDLPRPNQLYRENLDGLLKAEDTPDDAQSVLDYFQAGPDGYPPSDVFGFWTPLKNVASRDSLRLDPKYRWLWDFLGGLAYGDSDAARPLSDVLELVKLEKIAKGDVDKERRLIDLEYVESRQAIVRDDVPLVDEIGSDKISFAGCELAFSKLEPYLGKVMIEPSAEDLGSTEWIGLKRRTAIPLNVVAYLLMLTDVCGAYRRLQSGKRHARLDPAEFLNLRVELPRGDDLEPLADKVQVRRDKIVELRDEAINVRNTIDELFETPAEAAGAEGDEPAVP